MDDASLTFDQLGLKHGDIWGVFSVQGYVDGPLELKQGTTFPILRLSADD
jgi:hypothetical protein